MQCQFCGEDGKDSKEHVFATWLTETLGVDRPRVVYERPDGLHREWISKGHLGVTTGGICDNCNNQWMSSLENEAQPLLSPFIQGDWLELNTERRATLARWVLKTAAAVDLMNAERFFTGTDRRRLASQEPLADLLIFVWQGRLLAQYIVSSVDYRVFYESRRGEEMPAYVSTLTLGHAVFQTLVVRARKLQLRLPVTDNSRLDGALGQLWPSNSPYSVPRQVLSQQDHGALIDRFRPQLSGSPQ